jgi:hypothetical protein
MVRKSTLSLGIALALALGLAACTDTGIPTAVPVDGPRFDGGVTLGGGNLLPSDSTNVVQTNGTEDGEDDETADPPAIAGGPTLGGGN